MGHPCESNHSRAFLGENDQRAFSMKSAQRGYFERSSFLDEMPVVTLQRHPPVMATFFPILKFPSKRATDEGETPSSISVDATIMPEAPAQITAIFMKFG